MNQIDLSGRNAVVTGGARGIGYAISQRLLQSGAGICIWDVDTDAATEAVKELSKHGNVITQTVELTDADAVQAATDATLAELGSIDILCEELERRREEYGIHYVTVTDEVAEDFAPVVARLSGS